VPHTFTAPPVCVAKTGKLISVDPGMERMKVHWNGSELRI